MGVLRVLPLLLQLGLEADAGRLGHVQVLLEIRDFSRAVPHLLLDLRDELLQLVPVVLEPLKALPLLSLALLGVALLLLQPLLGVGQLALQLLALLLRHRQQVGHLLEGRLAARSDLQSSKGLR